MKAALPPPLTGIRPRKPVPARTPPGRFSHEALARILANPGEPLLYADWDRVLMLHYEVDPAVLRPVVPFPLDLHGGKAYVTLVAFTLEKMRPRRGGRLGRWLLTPVANHRFLNVRTYVRVGNETGIYFITEYMDNLVALKLGPLAFGLPYRFARMAYRHDWLRGHLAGRITDFGGSAALAYETPIDPAPRFAVPRAGSLTEWLMERYTAYTVRRGKRLLFRVWHPSWPNVPVKAVVRDDTLLRKHLPWFGRARYIGANFSPGVFDVWMGRPHPVPELAA
jgi:uncharacterized protein YqjF (DUF2071 family)